jgi:baculoviral IAP repeat-containing protein 6
VKYPDDYPNSSTKLVITTKSKQIQEWINKVGEIIDSSPASLKLNELLTQAMDLQKKKKAAKAKPKKAPRAEDMDASYFDDGLEIADHELELLKKKKRWRLKEEELRAQLKREKEKEKDSKTARVEQQQIFTSNAATGVLTNDLLKIMDESDKLGFSAEPIDDNIYRWNVKMFGFDPNSKVAKDLVDLKSKFGYDYIELDISFRMDLYPFYPPLVKVVRPRFIGFMMGRITSFEGFKLEKWDPVRDMSYYLELIKKLLEDYGRVNVDMAMNDKNKFTEGSYTRLEWLLLQLELLSDHFPRANLKYQIRKEDKYSTPSELVTTTNTAAPKPKEPTPAPTQPAVPGEKKEYWAKGTGYGHDSRGNSGWSVAAYIAAQKERDSQHEAVLDEIRGCLAKENAHKVAAEERQTRFLTIEESALVPVIEHYLNNDSLLDMERHVSLYKTLLGVVKAFTENEDLISLLDRLEHQKQSIYELMSRMHNQASIYMKVVNKGENKSVDGPLVHEILNTYALVESALMHYRKTHKQMDTAPVEYATNNNNSGLSAEEQKKQQHVKDEREYIEIMQQMQFDSADLSGTYQHYYKAQATDFASSKERVLRLAAETGNLSTSLPINLESSIFARMDEKRMDMMTAMITGPSNTPYSNGCFLFDIFFPKDYPNVPPNVWLRTTGNGSVRFNPNLYNNGKVCLSLLGTWSGAEGENWNKDTSTLLQVLVSVQSLILVPEPYFNEPGYERTMHTPEGRRQNRNYNENIFEQSIRWAMINQLRNPAYGYEEVIKAHFYLRKDAIFKEIEAWMETYNTNEFATAASKGRIETLVKELKEEIAKLKPPKK